MKKVSHNERENKFFTRIGIFSSFLLFTAFSVYIYSPVIRSHAEGANPVVTANIGSLIAITTSASELSLRANPNSFIHEALSVNVSTNSQYGYTLAFEDGDDNTSLSATAAGVSDALTSSFTGSKESSDMEDNTWGYSLNETNYYAIPVSGSPIALKRTNSPVSATYETTSVDFGIKVGMITSGTYQDTVKFTVYVNGQDGNPSDGTAVDDPEEEITGCASLDGVVDGVYTDTRDGNTYTVADMGDGHCWMTQNLRIANKTITSADSDVTRNYTIPASALGGNFISETSDGVYIDPKYGGYYTFTTMTAKNNNRQLTRGDATASICPIGWKVPSRDEWEAMISAEEPAHGDLIGDGYYTLTHLTTSPMNLNTGSGYAYGGRLYTKDNNYDQGSYSEGEFANYWTSTAPSSGNGTRIYLQKDSSTFSYIKTGDGSGRQYGYLVRCMSRNSW